MKKILLAGILGYCLAPAALVRAQNAHDASIHFLKDDRPGMVADYPFPERLVSAALKTRLTVLGKSKTQKGFEWYQGGEWPEIAPGHLDVYTRVDGKSNKSTVSILVSKGYDNYISTATDPEIAGKLQAFLNNLTPAIVDAQHGENIVAQEEVVRKAEKTYNESQHDMDKLLSERDRLDRKITDLKAEHAKNESSWIAEKARLDQMKSGK